MFLIQIRSSLDYYKSSLQVDRYCFYIKNNVRSLKCSDLAYNSLSSKIYFIEKKN